MWKINADLLFIMVEEHDRDFRKNHKCDCKNRVEYSDGRWYCEAMQKSRMKNKKIKAAVKEALVSSPFLPERSESVEKLLEINGLADTRF
jgi:hypothetical protein